MLFLIKVHAFNFLTIREAIMLVINDHEMIHAITKQLYPNIAKLCNTSSSRVERAI